jgi:hypothetical protein
MKNPQKERKKKIKRRNIEKKKLRKMNLLGRKNIDISGTGQQRNEEEESI